MSFDYDLNLGCFRNRLEDGYGVWPMKWEADFGLKQCLISGSVDLKYSVLFLEYFVLSLFCI
jgi:hypothetical protein